MANVPALEKHPNKPNFTADDDSFEYQRDKFGMIYHLFRRKNGFDRFGACCICHLFGCIFFTFDEL